MPHRLARAITAEFYPGLAVRAVLILLPLAAAALASGNEIWLRAGVASISIFIAAQKASLAPLGLLLHGLAILICFSLLYLALPHAPFFILGCAALAMAAIALTRWGAKFRSLGNFTFIPALYLACETAEDPATASQLAHTLAVLPYLAAALLPPLILCSADYARARPAAMPRLAYFTRLLRAPLDGHHEPYLASAITVAVAVAAAAALVEWRSLSHGQWVIWSAASVVTGDWPSARQKLGQRAQGLMLGVPAGAALGFLLPHTLFVYGFAALGAVVTLVAFKHYVPAFATRCFCAAIALVAVAQSATAAAARAENVLIGGLIGITAAFSGSLLAMRRRAV